MDRWTYTHSDRQTDRQTDRQLYIARQFASQSLRRSVGHLFSQ